MLCDTSNYSSVSFCIPLKYFIYSIYDRDTWFWTFKFFTILHNMKCLRALKVFRIYTLDSQKEPCSSPDKYSSCYISFEHFLTVWLKKKTLHAERTIGMKLRVVGPQQRETESIPKILLTLVMRMEMCCVASGPTAQQKPWRSKQYRWDILGASSNSAEQTLYRFLTLKTLGPVPLFSSAWRRRVRCWILLSYIPNDETFNGAHSL